MKPTTIFIRTYDKDAPWLRYCLMSLVKFASGFDHVVITTPKESDRVIRPLAEEFGCLYDVCDTMADDDYVGQQATKMHADTWCSGEVICFVDSDLVFLRPFTPSCLVDEAGRLTMLKTRYDTIKCPWQSITSGVVGFPVEWEYMRRFPLSYPRSLLPIARAHIEKVQGIEFGAFIRRIPGRFLSEFNALGAIAEKYMPEQFVMSDTAGLSELPPLYAKQFWSWGGITHEIRTEIETILNNE
jgi:hypothetical protein